MPTSMRKAGRSLLATQVFYKKIMQMKDVTPVTQPARLFCAIKKKNFQLFKKGIRLHHIFQIRAFVFSVTEHLPSKKKKTSQTHKRLKAKLHLVRSNFFLYRTGKSSRKACLIKTNSFNYNLIELKKLSLPLVGRRTQNN